MSPEIEGHLSFVRDSGIGGKWLVTRNGPLREGSSTEVDYFKIISVRPVFSKSQETPVPCIFKKLVEFLFLSMHRVL